MLIDYNTAQQYLIVYS